MSGDGWDGKGGYHKHEKSGVSIVGFDGGELFAIRPPWVGVGLKATTLPEAKAEVRALALGEWGITAEVADVFASCTAIVLLNIEQRGDDESQADARRLRAALDALKGETP